MKPLLLAVLSLTLFATGETLSSDCGSCISPSVVTISGSGYAPLKGNAYYMICVDGFRSNGQRLQYCTGVEVGPDMQFFHQNTFSRGSYEACSAAHKPNRYHTVLACTAFTVN